jgi:hypothetical protein
LGNFFNFISWGISMFNSYLLKHRKTQRICPVGGFKGFSDKPLFRG